MFQSPFKFLDSYTREDRKIFFGRDREITELYRRVFESKILLVYGISGTGKSSLINCGLASRFDDSDWLPVNVRRGSNIIDSLNDAFNKQALRPLKKNLSVAEKIQSIYLDHFKPVYLIFDQFEELFIFGNDEEKKGFIRIIKEIVGSETQCKVIFVIREEFLAGITEFEYDLPEIFANRFRVEKMKRANAILAIEGPCKVHNIETEAGFSEELIDKLCPAGNEIELTYLQIYLDRILRLATTHFPPNRGGQGGALIPSHGGIKEGVLFSKSLLSQAGNVSDLLGQFLEEQIREMEDQVTGMSILKSFVSVQGTKKQMTEPDILDSIGAFGTVLSHEALLKYLEKYVDLRILRERDEAGHFELRHDALAAKIYESFTLSEKELLEVRLFVENAYQAFNTRKTYLNGEDLQYLATYEKRLFLPPALTRFVRDSKEKLHSQQKALRRLTSVVALIFVILIAAAGRYYLNQKDTTTTKELIAVALLQQRADPLTSMYDAFKVQKKDSVSTVIKGIILSSFNELINRKINAGDTLAIKAFIPRSIPVKGSILSMQMNRSGNLLFGWTDQNEVYSFYPGGSGISIFKAENEIASVEISDNAKYVAVIYTNSNGEIFDIYGKKLFSFKTTLNYLMNSRLVRFFPAGKYFMASVLDSNAVIYDSTGTRLYTLTGHTGRLNSLDISPDGRFVVTASCDKKGIIWNFNHKTRVFSPYDTLAWHKDTIWSCEFSRTGKWILTASADSVLNIFSLNGNPRNIAFYFAVNYYHGPLYWFPRFYSRISKYYPNYAFLDAFYKKICDARFAADDRAIIALNYGNDNLNNGNIKGIYKTHVMYFGSSYDYDKRHNDSNPWIDLLQRGIDSVIYKPLKSLELSPDRLFSASSRYGDKDIWVLNYDGYLLLNLSGTFPLFSSDGRYLFYLENKNLRIVNIDIKDIYNYVFNKQIFGNSEMRNEVLKIL